jgi:hypothetical protein
MEVGDKVDVYNNVVDQLNVLNASTTEVDEFY